MNECSTMYTNRPRSLLSPPSRPCLSSRTGPCPSSSSVKRLGRLEMRTSSPPAFSFSHPFLSSFPLGRCGRGHWRYHLRYRAQAQGEVPRCQDCGCGPHRLHPCPARVPQRRGWPLPGRGHRLRLHPHLPGPLGKYHRLLRNCSPYASLVFP